VQALRARSPEPVRIAAAASLAKQAARLDGKLDNESAIKALAATRQTGQTDLRQMAVYALGFFGGEHASSALRDALNDEDRFVRYNAAIALARRGDLAAAGTHREMLNPALLDQAINLEVPAEKRTKIEAIELEALRALQTALDQGKSDLVRTLRPQIEALDSSDLAGVRNNALALLRGLASASPGERP
jgi:HEAT repeat protein